MFDIGSWVLFGYGNSEFGGFIVDTSAGYATVQVTKQSNPRSSARETVLITRLREWSSPVHIEDLKTMREVFIDRALHGGNQSWFDLLCRGEGIFDREEG